MEDIRLFSELINQFLLLKTLYKLANEHRINGHLNLFIRMCQNYYLEFPKVKGSSLLSHYHSLLFENEYLLEEGQSQKNAECQSRKVAECQSRKVASKFFEIFCDVQNFRRWFCHMMTYSKEEMKNEQSYSELSENKSMRETLNSLAHYDRTKSDSTLNIVEDQLERLLVEAENELKVEFDGTEGNEIKTEECGEDYPHDIIENEEVTEFSSEVTNENEHMTEKLCENIDKDSEILEDSGLEEDEDDDEGWITPSNIKSINKKKQLMNEEELKDAEVACITADFSMQNTLKHIGLNVLGVDGKLITTLRTFILRCHACFKITNRMEKIFCPHCGNKTLKRVSVTLNPDGTQKIWISTRRPINIRGMKYSLPAPKGGKHAVNPILVNDQREAQRWASQLGRAKNDPMHEDYDARAGISPFITRDVYSRSAQLGIKSGKSNHRGVYYWELKNPNVPMSTGKTRRKR